MSCHLFVSTSSKNRPIAPGSPTLSRLKSVGDESMFYWYVTVLCAIAGIVALRMRDASKEGYLRHEP
jgi:hypothetical protein